MGWATFASSEVVSGGVLDAALLSVDLMKSTTRSLTRSSNCRMC